jgi:hypothetical protein
MKLTAASCGGVNTSGGEASFRKYDPKRFNLEQERWNEHFSGDT